MTDVLILISLFLILVGAALASVITYSKWEHPKRAFWTGMTGLVMIATGVILASVVAVII